MGGLGRLKGEPAILSDASIPLLRRIADGQPRAMREGMDRFGGLVWSIARRHCRNPADAEDAVQEVFIDLWRHAGRFDAARGTEEAFVATIARRRLIDRYRRERRRTETVLLAEEIAESGRAAAEDVEARDEAARARRQIQRLHPDQRRVLELALVRGLSQSEIAEATDLPLGTVKTHARRGLARLRRLMAAAGPDEAPGGGPGREDG